jgi:PAS domain S-box-containing protein
VNLDVVRILLIDDDEDDFVNIRGVLREIRRSKFELEWESSYQAGLKALQEGKFDACLLDYRLGERTGLDLLHEAHELGITCPIILLTGYGDFETDVKAMQSGAADYLVKSEIAPPILERSIRYSVKHAFDMRELSEQRESFKTLLNSTFEGIVVHKNGVVLDANAAAGEIFGVSPQDLVEKSVLDFIRQDFRFAAKSFLEAPDETAFEAIAVRSDGQDIFIRLLSRKIEMNGQPLAILAIRDLTVQKQMEAQILQQDRLASLGLLASSLAHEIGTPLGVIRGRAELIARSTDPKIKSTMELITTQIDRVSKLVHSLLHIARGKQSEFATDVDLSTVIADVSNLMCHELQRKSIEFRVEDTDHRVVRAEPGPLGQVFLNLMVNSVYAIEEAKEGGRQGPHFISIRAEDAGSQIRIAVRDTGCGISEANLRQLFKPFFTTKDIGTGTGLGLATSYKLVQSWGGTMSVESKPGTGTTFIIYLNKAK